MKRLRAALLVAMFSLSGSTAYADALGGPCPSGQIFRANPTEPGAMHHAGGQCVDDPSASRCSAAPGHVGSGTLAIALGVGVATVLSSRRVRVSTR